MKKILELVGYYLTGDGECSCIASAPEVGRTTHEVGLDDLFPDEVQDEPIPQRHNFKITVEVDE